MLLVLLAFLFLGGAWEKSPPVEALMFETENYIIYHNRNVTAEQMKLVEEIHDYNNKLDDYYDWENKDKFEKRVKKTAL